jgi:hypothetical protein
MKTRKILQAAVAVVFFASCVPFLSLPGAQASGDSWEAVGDSQYLSDTSHGTPSLAFHPTNHDLYLAYVEEADTIRVMHYTGAAWENVGSAITSGELDEAKVAFNPETKELYLAYWDITLHKIVVLRYNGSSWVDVGTHGVSSGNGFSISFAFNPSTGNPYLAYEDQTINKLVVKMFNGSSWENVGPNGLSNDNADHISLAFNPSSNQPYVSFADFGSGHKVRVIKYNGSSWEDVGPLGVSSGSGSYTDLDFNPETNLPYVVYTDNDDNHSLKLKRFDGSAWQDVGSPMGDDPYGFEGQIAFCPSTNLLHVAYFNNEALHDLVVKKYNGSSWELVGSKGFNTNFGFDMDFGFQPSTNEPYTIYEDQEEGALLNHLAVYKFNKAVSNRPIVSYAQKKSTKRNIVFTFRDLKITTKKAWVKVWLGGKKVKVKGAKRSGNNLKVTLQVKYGKWARGNYNLRMQFKKRVGNRTHTDTWRSANALTIL